MLICPQSFLYFCDCIIFSKPRYYQAFGMRVLPQLVHQDDWGHFCVNSQYVSLVCRSVDGQLVSVAGYIWVGTVLKEQLDAVQVSRSSCIIQDCVSVAGLAIHVTTWWSTGRGSESLSIHVQIWR